MTSALFEARTDAAMRELEELDEPTFREHVVEHILHRAFPKRALSVDDAFLRRQAFLKNGPMSGRLHSGWVARDSVTDGPVFFGQEQMTELHAAVELSTKPVQRALIMREIELLMHRFKQCAIVYLFALDDDYTPRIVPFCSWRTVYELDRDESFVRAFYLNTDDELTHRAVARIVPVVMRMATENDLAIGFTRNEREFYSLEPGEPLPSRATDMMTDEDDNDDPMFDGTTMTFMSLYRFNAAWLYARRKEYIYRPGTEPAKWCMAIPVFHAPDEVRTHDKDIDSTLAWWLREYDPFLWRHVSDMLAPTDDGHLRFSLRLTHSYADKDRLALFGFTPARNAPLPREIVGVVSMMPVADHSTRFLADRKKSPATVFYMNNGARAPIVCNFLKEVMRYTLNDINPIVRVYRGSLMSTGWYLPIRWHGPLTRNVVSNPHQDTFDSVQITPTTPTSAHFSFDATANKISTATIHMGAMLRNVPMAFAHIYGDGTRRMEQYEPRYHMQVGRFVADLVKERNRDDALQRIASKLNDAGNAYSGQMVCVTEVEPRRTADHYVKSYDIIIESIFDMHRNRDMPASHVAFLKSVLQTDAVRNYLISLTADDAQLTANAPTYKSFVDEVMRVVAYASSNVLPGYRWSARASEKPSYRANMCILENFIGQLVMWWFQFRPIGIYMVQREMDKFIGDAQVHIHFERLFAFNAQRRLFAVMNMLRLANPVIRDAVQAKANKLSTLLRELGFGDLGERYDALCIDPTRTTIAPLIQELFNIERQVTRTTNGRAIDAVNAEIRSVCRPSVAENLVTAIQALIWLVIPSVITTNDENNDAMCTLPEECVALIKDEKFTNAATYIRARPARILDQRTILALLDAVADPSDRNKTIDLLNPLISRLDLPDGTVPQEERPAAAQLLANVNSYFAQVNWELPNDPRWKVRAPQTMTISTAPTAAHMPTAAPTAAHMPTAAHDEGVVSERTRLRRERIRAIIDAEPDTDTVASAPVPVPVYADYDTLFFDFVAARQNGDIGEQFIAPLKRFSLTTPHAHRLIEDISRQCAIHELFADETHTSDYARFLSGTEYAHRIMHTRWPVCGGVRLNGLNESAASNEEADATRVRDAAYDFILRINDEIFNNTSQPRSPAARATLANNRDMLRELGFTREVEFLNDPALERDSARWRDAYMTPERLEGGMRAARACLFDDGGLDFLLLTNVIPLDTDEAALRYELIERLGGSADKYSVYV